jgi:hypothetical protein
LKSCWISPGKSETLVVLVQPVSASRNADAAPRPGELLALARSSSTEARQRLMAITAENISSFLAGKPVHTV